MEQDIKIEDGLERLDEILLKMEEKDVNLSESFELYEEGMRLLNNLNNQIEEVEKKVMLLSDNGELTEFDGNEEE